MHKKTHDVTAIPTYSKALFYVLSARVDLRCAAYAVNNQ